MNKAYVTFRDQKSRDRALAVLDEFRWRKSTLTSKIAEAAPDPIVKAPEMPVTLSFDPDDKTPVNEKVVKSTTPLYNVTYEEQLEQKKKAAYSVMRKLGNEMAKTNPELQQFVRFHKLRRKGQICEVDDIKASPEDVC
ncbi:hypothetical protein SK128_006621 [Halocaridina rubra]|uniref:Uncharacterized protein n=1 Tax=Halocaridina rubra TaxID=373956 RepID=A0AAN8X482_HALRR